jgi:hypothetical protein
MFAENNSVYLVTAYGVFLGAMLVYGLSLVLRRASARREAKLIQQAREAAAAEAKESDR